MLFRNSACTWHISQACCHIIHWRYTPLRIDQPAGKLGTVIQGARLSHNATWLAPFYILNQAGKLGRSAPNPVLQYNTASACTYRTHQLAQLVPAWHARHRRTACDFVQGTKWFAKIQSHQFAGKPGHSDMSRKETSLYITNQKAGTTWHSGTIRQPIQPCRMTYRDTSQRLACTLATVAEDVSLPNSNKWPAHVQVKTLLACSAQWHSPQACPNTKGLQNYN